jgi:hypothetical protein
LPGNAELNSALLYDVFEAGPGRYVRPGFATTGPNELLLEAVSQYAFLSISC